jgi:hypothetical protein
MISCVCVRPFAGSERGSKQQLNLTYSRWLKECKATAPGDIPLIEEQEMIFQVT